jgi:hypothetical protein
MKSGSLEFQCDRETHYVGFKGHGRPGRWSRSPIFCGFRLSELLANAAYSDTKPTSSLTTGQSADNAGAIGKTASAITNSMSKPARSKGSSRRQTSLRTTPIASPVQPVVSMS